MQVGYLSAFGIGGRNGLVYGDGNSAVTVTLPSPDFYCHPTFQQYIDVYEAWVPAWSAFLPPPFLPSLPSPYHCQRKDGLHIYTDEEQKKQRSQ